MMSYRGLQQMAGYQVLLSTRTGEAQRTICALPTLATLSNASFLHVRFVSIYEVAGFVMLVEQKCKSAFAAFGGCPNMSGAARFLPSLEVESAGKMHFDMQRSARKGRGKGTYRPPGEEGGGCSGPEQGNARFLLQRELGRRASLRCNRAFCVVSYSFGLVYGGFAAS